MIYQCAPANQVAIKLFQLVRAAEVMLNRLSIAFGSEATVKKSNSFRQQVRFMLNSDYLNKNVGEPHGRTGPKSGSHQGAQAPTGTTAAHFQRARSFYGLFRPHNQVLPSSTAARLLRACVDKLDSTDPRIVMTVRRESCTACKLNFDGLFHLAMDATSLLGIFFGHLQKGKNTYEMVSLICHLTVVSATVI